MASTRSSMMPARLLLLGTAAAVVTAGAVLGFRYYRAAALEKRVGRTVEALRSDLPAAYLGARKELGALNVRHAGNQQVTAALALVDAHLAVRFSAGEGAERRARELLARLPRGGRSGLAAAAAALLASSRGGATARQELAQAGGADPLRPRGRQHPVRHGRVLQHDPRAQGALRHRLAVLAAARLDHAARRHAALRVDLDQTGMIDDPSGLATATAAALFALTFLFGRHVHPMQRLVKDRRSIISFGAGVSTAYLFMRMMPELSDARRTVAEGGLVGTGDGMIVYLAALTGFLLVYGLDHFRTMAGQPGAGLAGEGRDAQETGSRPYGMALYVPLLTYVLVREPAGSPVDTLEYALAISLHFLAVDHSLRDEMGEAYDRGGRFVLAAGCILGWALARMVDMADTVTALLLAFVSGGVIVNSALMELPSERNGRYLPFVAGSLIFGSVLMAV
jgi:hypothetical protein